MIVVAGQIVSAITQLVQRDGPNSVVSTIRIDLVLFGQPTSWRNCLDISFTNIVKKLLDSRGLCRLSFGLWHQQDPYVR